VGDREIGDRAGGRSKIVKIVPDIKLWKFERIRPVWAYWEHSRQGDLR